MENLDTPIPYRFTAYGQAELARALALEAWIASGPGRSCARALAPLCVGSFLAAGMAGEGGWCDGDWSPTCCGGVRAMGPSCAIGGAS